jgi:hypothetical protein
MAVSWPPRATDEDRRLRLFEDALMRHLCMSSDSHLRLSGNEVLYRLLQ